MGRLVLLVVDFGIFRRSAHEGYVVYSWRCGILLTRVMSNQSLSRGHEPLGNQNRFKLQNAGHLEQRGEP
jgi:hypothetical protein